jgi:hypothetical protein
MGSKLVVRMVRGRKMFVLDEIKTPMLCAEQLFRKKLMSGVEVYRKGVLIGTVSGVNVGDGEGPLWYDDLLAPKDPIPSLSRRSLPLIAASRFECDDELRFEESGRWVKERIRRRLKSRGT